MKTLKLLIGLIIFSNLFISCTKENDFLVNEESSSLKSIINAKIIDIKNNIEIEVTTEYLKEKWEKELLEEEGTKFDLINFEILQSKTEDGINTYFLKATSKGGSIKTGAFLTLMEGSDNVYLLRGKTCSCKGCPNGCDLLTFGTRCRCTSCPVGGSQSCIKTETVVIDE